MYFIDMKTVRLWFLMNTNYKDTEKNRATGLLEKPKFQEAEESCNFSGNCSPVVNSNLQNHFQSPFSIEEALYNILE